MVVAVLAAVQQDPGGGDGTEREPLEQLLAGNDEASSAALAALRGGGPHVVREGTASAESLAGT
ncbi:hypothetical protein ABZ471_40150 [Streptomyces sp. NPDC005728]|uniref:hypothetical protein n=1 Tax=Streptomyces sp. NPDC005728 TaxID=3157054 RepID=UPI0033DEF833